MNIIHTHPEKKDYPKDFPVFRQDETYIFFKPNLNFFFLSDKVVKAFELNYHHQRFGEKMLQFSEKKDEDIFKMLSTDDEFIIKTDYGDMNVKFNKKTNSGKLEFQIDKYDFELHQVYENGHPDRRNLFTNTEMLESDNASANASANARKSAREYPSTSASSSARESARESAKSITNNIMRMKKGGKKKTKRRR